MPTDAASGTDGNAAAFPLSASVINDPAFTAEADADGAARCCGALGWARLSQVEEPAPVPEPQHSTRAVSPATLRTNLDATPALDTSLPPGGAWTHIAPLDAGRLDAGPEAAALRGWLDDADGLDVDGRPRRALDMELPRGGAWAALPAGVVRRDDVTARQLAVLAARQAPPPLPQRRAAARQ